MAETTARPATDVQRQGRRPRTRGMPMRAAAVAGLMLSGLLGPLAAQSDLLVIQVVQRDGFGAPLPNAEVLPGGRAPSRLTDARGEVRLPWTGAPYRLVVRQIGFTPLDTTLVARPADGRVRLALATVAYRLPDVVAGVERGCPVLASAAQRERTASILEQLKIGAEHFEAFRREYRWEVRSERRTGVLTSATSAQVTEVRQETQDSRTWGEPYRRGRVLSYGGPTGFWANLLFVSALASPAFWQAHCFAAEESPADERTPTVRLRFTPRADVTTPDWSGTAILDSATAELRRVEFELAHLRKPRPPRRLIGYTDFARVSPYVMVPRESGALWWTTPPTDTLPSWPRADQAQVLITQSLHWIGKARPPGVDSVTVVTPAAVPATAARVEPAAPRPSPSARVDTVDVPSSPR